MWRSSGDVGRAMMGAMRAGHCMLGHLHCHDAYGNRVPSRHEVAPGTLGSRDYVVERMGEEYADRIGALP